MFFISFLRFITFKRRLYLAIIIKYNSNIFIFLISFFVYLTNYFLYNESMKIVHLADKKGNTKTKNIGFSWKFFFLGPFYLLVHLKIFSAILLFLLYFYLLPIPGMNLIGEFVLNNFNENISDAVYMSLLLFRTIPFIFIGIILSLGLHLYLSFNIEGVLIKRLLKNNKYLPITENDARLLISCGAVKHTIPLAGDKIFSVEEDNQLIKNNIDVPYILNDDSNSEINRFRELEKNKRLTELNELYKLGLMTREEFEIQRARIVKSYK